MRRPEQNQNRQFDIIEQFQRKGELHKLAFAIEMDMPKKWRGTDGKRYAAAEMPTGGIPCIPLVDAWFVSLAMAEELASLFARENEGKGIDFYPALCTIDTDGLIVYGADGAIERDYICMECGRIVTLPDHSPPDDHYFCCRQCLDAIAAQL